MKVLLVRHGESTGNRDHIMAGITDNELTNHGFLQASRLATYLTKHYGQTLDAARLCRVYCSDLKRANRTAGEIAKAFGTELIVTKLLREQDLGWREGRLIKDCDKRSPVNAAAMEKQPGESKLDMDHRASSFIHQYLDNLVNSTSEASPRTDEAILIVVSHGLFLLRLYYKLTEHMGIISPPPVSWSNTGCTTLNIPLQGRASVTDVNSVEHLQGLKRTRAGVGSSEYDTKQQKVSDLFKSNRAKAEEKQQFCEILEVKPHKIDADGLDQLDLEAQIRAIDAACESTGLEQGTGMQDARVKPP